MTTSRISLLSLILHDLRQMRLLLVLSFLVMMSALAVVYLAHLNRQQVIALDTLRQQYDKLDVQWRNLILEESSLDEHSRISHIAKTQLGMHRPTPDEEIRVQAP